MKLKNILAENLIRFGVKNLKESQKLRILESAKYADKVTFNNKTYYVHATAEDFDNRGISIAQNKYAGKSTFNPDNFVVLSIREVPGYDYTMAYEELQQGDYVVVNANEVGSSSVTTTALKPGSWEAFTAAIANKINTNKNDPRTNLTSAEIDSAYEKLNQKDREDLWNGIWGEYKWSVGTNKPGGAEQAVDQAIRNYFSKVK